MITLTIQVYSYIIFETWMWGIQITPHIVYCTSLYVCVISGILGIPRGLISPTGLGWAVSPQPKITSRMFTVHCRLYKLTDSYCTMCFSYPVVIQGQEAKKVEIYWSSTWSMCECYVCKQTVIHTADWTTETQHTHTHTHAPSHAPPSYYSPWNTQSHHVWLEMP